MPTPTTPPAITAVPAPQPVRNDRTTFSPRVDAFVTWLPTHITDLIAALVNVYDNAVSAYNSAAAALTSQTAAGTSATNSAISASAAAASAVTALNAPGTSATSTTSLTIGTGAQSLTIQTGKSLVVGMPIIIARTSDPALQKMQATITAYNSGTGALDVTVPTGGTTGAGTYTDWTISLVGATGASVIPIYTKTALTLIVNFEHKLDSTDAAFTVTMPASATLGDTITLIDPRGTWATNNVTVNRNGNSFVDQNGTVKAEDLILNQNRADVILFYDGTNWRVI